MQSGILKTCSVCQAGSPVDRFECIFWEGLFEGKEKEEIFRGISVIPWPPL